MRTVLRLLVPVLLLSAPVVRAEVQDATAAGFTSVNTAGIASPVDEVYAAFLEIEHWWHPDHTYWGDAANLYLEARIGGVFGEHKPDGRGAVRHLEVLWLDPEKGLRLQGGLGPLQTHAVQAVLTVELVDPEGGSGADTCMVTFRYAVGGYVPGDLTDWAPVVDGVLEQQLARLKSVVETGSPTAADAR